MERRIEGSFAGIRTPNIEVVTIPKGEYDLLIEIKNKFLGVNGYEQTHKEETLD